MQEQNRGIAAVLSAYGNPLLHTPEPDESALVDSIWNLNGHCGGNLILPKRSPAPTAPLNGARPGRIYPRRRVKRQDRKIFMPPTIARFIANIHGAFARSDFWKRGMAIAAS
jgi:hypothetical protein